MSSNHFRQIQPVAIRGHLHPANTLRPELAIEAQSRIIPHTKLIEAIDLSVRFNLSEEASKGDYLAQQFEQFTEACQTIPGYLGVFGTGHPFYATEPDGTVVAIPEVTRFLGDAKDKIEADRDSKLGGWICGGCQVINALADLKQECRSCEDVMVTPRDIFKALPDLDFWIVAEENDEAVEAYVTDRTSRAGFRQSDIDIHDAIQRSVTVLSELETDGTSQERLPIDLHIITKTQLLECLKAVNDNAERGIIDYVPISPRSLHVTWEAVDEPYDFTKDFLFSFTSENWNDQELVNALSAARKKVAETFSPDELLAYIRNNHPKEKRQLDDQRLETIFKRRVTKWANIREDV